MMVKALKGTPKGEKMFVQIEDTPNPNCLKFIPGQIIVDNGSVDFPTIDAASASPLAKKIFGIDGVDRVFFGKDYVTVTKGQDDAWDGLKTLVIGVIVDHLAAGLPVMNEVQSEKTDDAKDDDPIISQIKELLDTRVRPAVAMDGGDITFHEFKDGIVYLEMRGACSGCPSSTMTLKAGIENLLRYYIPEVNEVRPINEPDMDEDGLDGPMIGPRDLL